MTIGNSILVAISTGLVGDFELYSWLSIKSKPKISMDSHP